MICSFERGWFRWTDFGNCFTGLSPRYIGAEMLPGFVAAVTGLCSRTRKVEDERY